MNAAHRIAILLFAGLSIEWFGTHSTLAGETEHRIQPYPGNPFYWQYKGQPVLLLGDDLLSQREPNEAYCLAEEARQYAVYFPAEGSVVLDTSRASTALSVRWYNVDRGQWHAAETAQEDRFAKLTTPGPGQWVVMILAP